MKTSGFDAAAFAAIMGFFGVVLAVDEVVIVEEAPVEEVVFNESFDNIVMAATLALGQFVSLGRGAAFFLAVAVISERS